MDRIHTGIALEQPDEDAEAITRLPEALIEVISRRYEAKDLEIGPRFYLSHGGKDGVFDPCTQLVLHMGRDGANRQV